MFEKIIILGLYFILTCGCVYCQPSSNHPEIKVIEPISKDDRILILSPHPDDETIGCAGIIQEAVNSGADIHVIYLTNGDHNELAFIVYEKRIVFRKGGFIYMGRKRQEEAIKAVKLLGLSENNLIFLGYPDFGTFTIFKDFWQTSRPFKDILTRISSVPYLEDFSYGAPYTGESILSDLERVLKLYKPDKIFVSHPADVNADHKALYLFLEVALSNLSKLLPRPKIYPYLIHCAGWPLPRHYHPELPLLPPVKFLNSQIQWVKYELSQEQLDKKYQAVLCHKTQVRSSAFYLFSFVRKNELFGNYQEAQSLILGKDTALDAKRFPWDTGFRLPSKGTRLSENVPCLPLSLEHLLDFSRDNLEKDCSVDSGVSWNERIFEFFRSFNIFNLLEKNDRMAGDKFFYKPDVALTLSSEPYSPEILLRGGVEKTAKLHKPGEDSHKSVEVGLENHVVYSIEDKSFLIHINKKSGFSRRFSAMFYIFGYSYKTPFPQMPKIRIVSRYRKFRIFDGKKKINPAGVTLDIIGRELIVKIPLRIIGNPDFVFLSVKTAANALPIEATGFRKVNLKTR